MPPAFQGQKRSTLSKFLCLWQLHCNLSIILLIEGRKTSITVSPLHHVSGRGRPSGGGRGSIGHANLNNCREFALSLLSLSILISESRVLHLSRFLYPHHLLQGDPLPRHLLQRGRGARGIHQPRRQRRRLLRLPVVGDRVPIDRTFFSRNSGTTSRELRNRMNNHRERYHFTISATCLCV